MRALRSHLRMEGETVNEMSQTSPEASFLLTNSLLRSLPMKPKTNRGGVRTGAGRPPGRTRIEIRVDIAIAEELKKGKAVIVSPGVIHIIP